jgi:predicted membrane protein
MTKRILAILAYMLPTFPLGYVWHLATFADYYKSLEVYREELLIPLGICSMLIQGIAWSVIYERMFRGEPIWRGAVKFAALAAPIAWSFMVLAVAAKHRMASVSGFLLIETAFIAVQYAVVSPLIAAVYAHEPRPAQPIPSA